MDPWYTASLIFLALALLVAALAWLPTLLTLEKIPPAGGFSAGPARRAGAPRPPAAAPEPARLPSPAKGVELGQDLD